MYYNGSLGYIVGGSLSSLNEAIGYFTKLHMRAFVNLLFRL